MPARRVSPGSEGFSIPVLFSKGMFTERRKCKNIITPLGDLWAWYQNFIFGFWLERRRP
jgi:hypothetical protein